jgi:hypothetical protein
MPKPDKITYKGKTMSIRKWAQRLNISTEGLSCRLKKGLALHQALKPRDIYTPRGIGK